MSALITTHYGTNCAIVCSGDLDLASRGRFSEAVDVCLDRRPSGLLIDCRRVEFVAACAICVLLDVASRCEDLGVSLQINLRTHAERILTIIGLDELRASGAEVDFGPDLMAEDMSGATALGREHTIIASHTGTEQQESFVERGPEQLSVGY